MDEEAPQTDEYLYLEEDADASQPQEYLYLDEDREDDEEEPEQLPEETDETLTMVRDQLPSRPPGSVGGLRVVSRQTLDGGFGGPRLPMPTPPPVRPPLRPAAPPPRRYSEAPPALPSFAELPKPVPPPPPTFAQRTPMMAPFSDPGLPPPGRPSPVPSRPDTYRAGPPPSRASLPPATPPPRTPTLPPPSLPPPSLPALSPPMPMAPPSSLGSHISPPRPPSPSPLPELPRSRSNGESAFAAPSIAWPSQRSSRPRPYDLDRREESPPDPYIPPNTHGSQPPQGLNGTWRMESPQELAAMPRVNLSAPVPVHPSPPPEPWPRVALSTPPRRITDSVRPVPPPSVVPAAPASEPFNGKGGRIALILGAISLVLSVLLAILLLLPSHGRLRVALVGEDTAPVARAEVFVDGEKKCDVVPCFINELGPGQKTIQVLAPGFVPAQVSEQVESGKERLVLVTLKPSNGVGSGSGAPGEVLIGSATPATTHLIVDGADRGNLPARLTGLAPGPHRLRFEAGDRYQALDRAIEVGSSAQDLGVVKLKVLRGRLLVDVSDDGARVTLTDVETHSERTLRGPWPVAVDLDASHRWLLTASERGMRDFASDIAFDDGQADKNVRVVLDRDTSTPSVGGPIARAQAPVAQSAPRRAARDSDDEDDKQAAPSGTGTLNINSLPASKVLLDGRPLGSTPKVGVQVPAGTHTVTFKHPDLGTKSITVNVGAGQEQAASVRFKRED